MREVPSYIFIVVVYKGIKVNNEKERSEPNFEYDGN